MPWIAVLATALLLAVCWALERSLAPIWSYFALAGGIILWALVAWEMPSEEDRLGPLDPPGPRPRRIPLALALLAAALGFWKADGAEFRAANVLPWISSVTLWLWAWWPPGSRPAARETSGRETRRRRVAGAALAAVVLVGIFFCFHDLTEVPGNPTSDHAEKLLDLWDMTRGERPVFFFRNTGREPLQFYWTFALMEVFGLPLRYRTLLIGTAVIGVSAVLAMYLAGRELQGRWLGLGAAALVAWGKWPVSLARQGLRYTFAVLPTALAVWALLRYMRRGDRLSALAAGAMIGVGLYGYTAFRVVPLLVALALGFALLDRRRRGRRWRVAGDFVLIAATAALVFLPLLKLMPGAGEREHFWYRTATRALDAERALDGRPLGIFLGNVETMLRAFHWPHVGSVVMAGEPFLDIVTGALLIAGVVFVVVRAFRGSWRGIWLLPCVFILTLPSSLSLAFPEENPSLNRAGAAIPVVFLLAALPLAYFAREFTGRGSSRIAGLAALAVVVLFSVQQNFQSYFVRFRAYARTVLAPSGEIAAALREYRRRGVPYTHAYYLPVYNLPDARNLAFELDSPTWPETNLVMPGDLPETEKRPLVFVYHPDDTARLEALRRRYPGLGRIYAQELPGRNFGLHYVPATTTGALPPR